MADKRAAPDPDTAEELRQVTRAAHEALKDLRAGVKQARSAIEEAHRATMAEATAWHSTQASAAVAAYQAAVETIDGKTEHLERRMEALGDHIGTLLGSKDPRDLLTEIVQQLAPRIEEEIERILNAQAEGLAAERRRRAAGQSSHKVRFRFGGQ